MRPAYIVLRMVLPFLALAACATGDRPDPPLRVVKANASIPFANAPQAIDTWTWRKDGSLLLESGGRFYHATIFQPCTGYVHGDRLAFKPTPSGSFDKFSSVVVHGHACPLSALDEVANPRAPRS